MKYSPGTWAEGQSGDAGRDDNEGAKQRVNSHLARRTEAFPEYAALWVLLVGSLPRWVVAYIILHPAGAEVAGLVNGAIE